MFTEEDIVILHKLGFAPSPDSPDEYTHKYIGKEFIVNRTSDMTLEYLVKCVWNKACWYEEEQIKKKIIAKLF